MKRIKNILLVILMATSVFFAPILPGLTQEAYADEDSVAPVLNEFKIVNTSVTRPGVVQIELNITEEDSGFSDFDLSLSWNKNGAPQSGSICTGLEYGGASGDMCSNFQLSIDQNSKQFGEYSGLYTFNLYTGKNANISDYTITRLRIRDKYGNEKTYEGEALNAIACNGKTGFSITGNSSGDDYIPPVLSSYKIVNTSVSRPGTVQIQLDIFEEGAGFSDFAVSLEWTKGSTPQSGNICTGLEYGGASGDMCSNFEISLNKNSKKFGGGSGLYTFDLKIGERANISKYTITELWIRDKGGNETRYSVDELPILATNGNNTFSVTGDSSSDDVVAPKLNSFEILNPTVNRPGVLKLKINITEAGSGLSDIALSLSWSKNGTRKSGSIGYGLEYGGAGGDMCSNFDFYNDNNWKNFGGKTGSYIFTLLIGERADLSTYTIDRIWIRDKYDNTFEVGTTNTNAENNIVNYSVSGSNSFVLKDEFNYSFTTGTNNANLAKKLNSMPVGTAAKVEIAGDKVLSKACLDAIKGKDKTIVAYSSGIQWVIRGNQLNGTTKDLNLEVTVSPIQRGEDFTDGDSSSWSLSEDSVKLEFYPNGTLPGKMQVRFKSDTLYDKGISGVAPELYYFDGENLILEDGDADLNFDGTDKWCYVNITHNSTFAVSNTAALKLKKSNRPRMNTSQKGKDGTAVGEGASAKVAEKAITSLKTNTDPKGSVFAKLTLRSTKQTKNSIKLKWAKLSKAKKYVIYGNKCGKNTKPKKIATTTGTIKTLKKVAGKKLKKGSYYKFIIVALDKNNKVVSTSTMIYVAPKGGKVCNHKSVTVKKSILTKAKKLKKGKTLKLNAKAVTQSKKLKVKKYAVLRYESTNKKIATVSKKGVVKAKKKGTCFIYAYAQNGVFKKIKVVVK